MPVSTAAAKLEEARAARAVRESQVRVAALKAERHAAAYRELQALRDFANNPALTRLGLVALIGEACDRVESAGE